MIKYYNNYSSVKTLVKSGNTQNLHLKGIKEGIGERNYIKREDVLVFTFDTIDDIKDFRAKYDYLYIFKDNVWKCYDKFLNFKEICVDHS